MYYSTVHFHPAMGYHSASRILAHASTVTKVHTKNKKNEQNHGVPRARNDVLNGSGTSAGQARLMMSEFAVAPARLIDNGGRRAIGIALRPQHIVGDVLGMNRCHGRLHRATRPGEAMEELDSPYHRCAGRADRDRQGAVVIHGDFDRYAAAKGGEPWGDLRLASRLAPRWAATHRIQLAHPPIIGGFEIRACSNPAYDATANDMLLTGVRGLEVHLRGAQSLLRSRCHGGGEHLCRAIAKKAGRARHARGSRGIGVAGDARSERAFNGIRMPKESIYADATNPRIPEICVDAFGSPGRLRVME
ncbi:hypothetical protein THAOC_34700 [Thalassiosira oceanica]|uniref:DUF6820 domain-containing protein n=1 Tax=Thalassiosira oceanica TaxID=159749 RepID=K0R4L2_THAOC|nr:hypothetical protein THAOC_34700 [Thalassiosira oceanica]|eukprot:EJK46624.1 hypothetical protein THAOC_34700 [Thalassiosira oceanica]